MDELAAAASVLAMSVDPESEDGMLLEMPVGTAAAIDGAEPIVESTDKENVGHQTFPVEHRLRAELPKVMTRAPNAHPSP